MSVVDHNAIALSPRISEASVFSILYALFATLLLEVVVHPVLPSIW